MLDVLNDENWRQVFGGAGERTPRTADGERDWSADHGEIYNEGTPSPCEGATCSADPFVREDVAEVLASRAGEHDGDRWLMVVRLLDGRFAFLEGGCDYTGWD